MSIILALPVLYLLLLSPLHAQVSGNAIALQGVRICSTAPTNGQAIAYNSSTGCWEPTSVNGVGGSVTSFNSRTGAITPASGDYTATLVTNTPAGNIAASTVQAALNELDTEKALVSHSHSGADITSGTIALARGGFATDISGITGVLKLTAGAPSAVTGTATDCILVNGTTSACLSSVSTTNSITGNGTSGTPIKLVNDTASPGNNKVYGTDGSGVRGWKDDPAGGGGGTDALSSGNCAVTKTSNTIITISTPCRWGDGANQVLGSSATGTLSGSNGTSTVYVYGTESGLVLGHQLGGATLTCSAGCTVSGSSITGFPFQTTPIATAAYTTNVFATPADARSLLARPLIEADTDGTVVVSQGPAGQIRLRSVARAYYYFPLAGIYTSDGTVRFGGGWNSSVVGSNNDISTPSGALFADGAGPTGDARMVFDLPPNYAGGTISARFAGWAESGNGTPATVVLGVRTACAKQDGVLYNSLTLGTEQTVTVPVTNGGGLGNGERGVGDLASLTVPSGCTGTNQHGLLISVRRLPTDAADTWASKGWTFGNLVLGI